jgi:predicted dehydrogenase
MNMKKLRFAILGCGFWSQFQLGGWKELKGAECVALYNGQNQKPTIWQKGSEYPAPMMMLRR